MAEESCLAKICLAVRTEVCLVIIRTPQAEYPGLVMDKKDSLDLRSFQSHGNSRQSESFTQLFVMVQEQQSLLLKLLSGQEELKEQQDEIKIWQEQTNNHK